MREREIETYLVRRVKELGGIAYKFVSPGHTGVPDRLVCLPGGRIYFVEVKTPGGTMSESQWREYNRLLALGKSTYIIDSKGHVDLLISIWMSGGVA